MSLHGVFCLLAMVAGSYSFRALPAHAQHQPSAKEQANIDTNAARHFGDAPDNPGPLATDLGYSTKPADVAKAMRKVADWQLRSHLPNADDQSVAQTYLELYLLPKEKDPALIKPAQTELDAILAAPRTSEIPGKEIPWWWCDALFMAPPVWARMYAATGDHKYIDYLDEEWARTSDRLYDPNEHLYFRDSTYLTRTEPNGKKMFWSRGNGWVLAGIVRTLQYLPKNDPARIKYLAQFKEMAAKIAELQCPDGLWRAGLLDPAD